MKTIVLAVVLALSALQAEDVVHYDTHETKKPEMSKPNYPNNDIHTNTKGK